MTESDVPPVWQAQQEDLKVTDNELPEGTAYHMNSRRLKTRQLRQIATALGATTESASAEDTRIIIEGKLWERDKNPSEVQVII